MKRRHLPATIAAMAVLATLAITAAPREAHADPGATFTVNPIDLVNGYFNFEIETALGPIGSFHAGMDFLVWEGVFNDSKDDVLAMGPILGLRLFPFLGAPAGLWAGPYAGVSYIRVKRGQVEDTGAGTTLGGMIGYTLILAEVFVASVGIGAGHRNFTTDVDGERIGHRGLEPRFRLALGFAF